MQEHIIPSEYIFPEGALTEAVLENGNGKYICLVIRQNKKDVFFAFEAFLETKNDDNITFLILDKGLVLENSNQLLDMINADFKLIKLQR